MSDLLDSLNPMQRQGVVTTEGPVLILAGAGSGKTRVLTHRVAYLISEKHVQPWNILAITFTNKAAAEMKERVNRLCDEDGEKVWVATFHATCGRILRVHAELLGYTPNFTIYDTDDQKTLMRRVAKTLNLDSKMYGEKMLLGRVSVAKNTMKDPDQIYKEAGDHRERKIAEAYEEYQKQLKANDAMDFDDMLMLTVKLFREHPEVLASYQQRFRYIMVDEYQDTNTVQFMFISLLAAAHRNICVVGDDDQSIYKFRGADIRNILDFEKTFTGATVIKLEQNYRSTGNILDVANKIIAHNKSRKAKTLWTGEGRGDLVDYREYGTGFEEAEYVITDIKANLQRFAYGDCAVLYRTNAQSRLFEEKCVMYSVPYKLVGGVNFYQRMEIKDIISYLKTVDGALDDLAVRRIINAPKRGIGQTTVDRISEYAAMKGISFYNGLEQVEQVPGMNSGTISKIRSFTDMIEGLRLLRGGLGLKELVETVIVNSGYKAALEAEKTVEAESRLENIQELVNKAAEYPDEPGDQEALTHFLEEVALIADVDTLSDDENRVVLMTLHGAKGLEFPRVYMPGMEEGLFPSMMSMNTGDESDIEEERRLCYVGVTRAREKLTLTSARSRMVNGETRYSYPSRFIEEIPGSLLDRDKAGAGRKPSGSTFRFGGRGSSSYVDYNYGDNSSHSGDLGSRGTSHGSSRRDEGFVKAGSYGNYGAPSGVAGTFAGGAGTISTGSASAYMGKTMGAAKLTSLDYGVGDRVKHIKFGQGTVEAVEQGKKDFEVTVKFDSVGSKKLFASFAKLEKI